MAWSDAAGGYGVAVKETERLIASDKVEGTAVRNRQGEAIGSVHTLMIDKRSGQVDCAVLGFGGFLGIGERYHPLPWRALTHEPRAGGYVADVTRERLERAPSHASDEAPWDRPGHGRSVCDYYGPTCPYAGI